MTSKVKSIYVLGDGVSLSDPVPKNCDHVVPASDYESAVAVLREIAHVITGFSVPPHVQKARNWLIEHGEL